MAAISAVSNVNVGARSVAFKATAVGADTLAFSVIAAAYLTAGGVATSAIYSFLTTTHTDAAGTLAALAAAGAIVDVITDATGISTFVGGDNSLSVSGASSISCRIALASSIAS